MSDIDLAFESEYDKFGDFYYEFVKSEIENSAAPSLMVRTMLESIGDVEGERVLDLACGEGYLSRILAEMRANVTGVDISANLLEHARKQSEGLAVEYLRDDAQELSRLDSDSFDVVICNMALMDIADLDRVLGAVHRVLKSNRKFVFSILHPCFQAPFGPGEEGHVEVDEAGNFVAGRVVRYTEEGKWYTSGSGMLGTLGSFHRMLSTYLNALIETGFELRGIAEPTLPPAEYEDLAGQWSSRIPRVLIIESVRL